MAGGGVLEVVVDRLKTAKNQVRRLEEAIEQAWKRSNGAATIFTDAGARAVREGLVCPKCARTFDVAARGALLVPIAGRRVPHLPRLRPHHRDRLGQGHSRRAPVDRRRARSGRGTASRPRGSARCSGSTRSARRSPPTGRGGSSPTTQKQMVIDGEGSWSGGKYPGLRAWFQWLETRTYKMHVRVFLARFRSYDSCATCGGKRLNDDGARLPRGRARSGGVARARARRGARRLEQLSVPRPRRAISCARELSSRLGYLERVGLGYLALDRPARTLSGGEAQRVSLTAALGSSLTGALFVLDEPTVGLHPTDVPPLRRRDARALRARQRRARHRARPARSSAAPTACSSSVPVRERRGAGSCSTARRTTSRAAPTCPPAARSLRAAADVAPAHASPCHGVALASRTRAPTT